MSKILTLTSVLFKSMILSGQGTNKRKGGKNLVLTFGIIGALMILSYVFPITIVIRDVVIQFKGFINPSLFIELFIPLIALSLLVFSVLTIISYYYLSTDITALLPLPLKPRDILIARYILVITSLYVFEFLFFSPMLIGYGLGANNNVLYYLLAFLILLIIPMVPVSIMSIIITTIMRFGNITKNKDKFTYVALVISLLIGVGSSTLPNYFVENNNVNPDQISQIGQSMAKFTNYIMPYLRPAINALTTTQPLIAILNILLFIIVSVASVVLFVLISSKVYLKAVMAGGESKGKKKEKVDVRNEIKTNSVFKSYAIKEWRIMFRTPIYNMNLIMVDLIMVVILGFSLIGGNAANTEEGSSMLNQLLNMRLPSQVGGYLFFILAGCLFLNGISAISTTAISREGKTAWFMKFIPVPPIVQINAKIFFGIIVHLFIPVLVLIATLVIGIITILDFILILIPLVIMTIYFNYWNILIDLAKPKLNWDNEAVAVKQNINTLFSMLIAVLIGAIFFFIGGILVYANNVRTVVSWGLISALGIGLGTLFLLVSSYILVKVIDKIKSMINWTIIINIFSTIFITGGIILFVGIFEVLNHFYGLNFGIGTWSIIISLCTITSLILLYKGIVKKGDSILQNID